jgi:hypothetical protein
MGSMGWHNPRFGELSRDQWDLRTMYIIYIYTYSYMLLNVEHPLNHMFLNINHLITM